MSTIPIFDIKKINQNYRIKEKIRLARLRLIARKNQLQFISPFKEVTMEKQTYTEIKVGMDLIAGESIESIDQVEIIAPKKTKASTLQKVFFIDKPLRHQMGLFRDDTFMVANIQSIMIPSYYKIDWDLYGGGDQEWMMIAQSSEETITVKIRGTV